MPFYRLLWEDGYSLRLLQRRRGAQRADRPQEPARRRRLRPVRALRRGRVRGRLRQAGATCRFSTSASMIRVSPQLMRLQAFRTRLPHRLAASSRTRTCAQVFSFHSLLVGGNPFTSFVDLHADPRARAQVGRVLPARRHRRAGRCAGPTVRGAGRRVAARLPGRNGSAPRTAASRASTRPTAGAPTSTRWPATPTSSTPTASCSPTNPLAQRRAARLRAQAIQHVAVRDLLRHPAAPPAPRAPQRAVRTALPRAARRHLRRAAILADDFSLYLHAPTATDPAIAPEGCEAFYVLSPVPHLGKAADRLEHEGPRYRDRILDYLRAALHSRASSARPGDRAHLHARTTSATSSTPTTAPPSRSSRSSRRAPTSACTIATAASAGCTSSAPARIPAPACPASSTRPRRPPG